MKQILQSLKTGESEVADVPCPEIEPHEVLIETEVSLISKGTERMLVDFGRSGWIERARSHPDKVRKVLQKARNDGPIDAIQAVRRKLDEPLSLGYSNVGRVIKAGASVRGLKAGDRVVSNGPHAEMVAVPELLCAKIPDGVQVQDAVFTVLGAIGLQGIRLISPTLGETVVVMGLGVIGLLCVQMLKANGCRVLAIDYDAGRLAMANNYGAETFQLKGGRSPVQAAMEYSNQNGVDAVLITAATSSHDPVHYAAHMCRKRGRIVLVGVTGLNLNRDDFYEKELSFQVSCSYGPGRYDAAYEEKGIDYPIGFVRWSEQRNFSAVLEMMASSQIQTKDLISHHFDIEEAAGAYDLITGDEPSLGVMLDYSAGNDGRENKKATKEKLKTTLVLADHRPVPKDYPQIGFIGAGNYARSILIPAFKKAPCHLQMVASIKGVNAMTAARKYNFEAGTSNIDEVLKNETVNSVVIATRHNTHADFVCRALRAGKNVFVEKPLALTLNELKQIDGCYNNAASNIVMVGFNRRFSEHTMRLKGALQSHSGPKSFIMRVNAGGLPSGHWTVDKDTGGGRIIGEACHFIDLLRYLSGSPIQGASIQFLGDGSDDTATIDLKFTDGSIGTVHYFTNGHRTVKKERLEVYSNGGIAVINNFQKTYGYGFRGLKNCSTFRQDKGQNKCAASFIRAIRAGQPSPIPYEEIIEVARCTIALANGMSYTGP